MTKLQCCKNDDKLISILSRCHMKILQTLLSLSSSRVCIFSCLICDEKDSKLDYSARSTKLKVQLKHLSLKLPPERMQQDKLIGKVSSNMRTETTGRRGEEEWGSENVERGWKWEGWESRTGKSRRLKKTHEVKWNSTTERAKRRKIGQGGLFLHFHICCCVISFFLSKLKVGSRVTKSLQLSRIKLKIKQEKYTQSLHNSTAVFFFWERE